MQRKILTGFIITILSSNIFAAGISTVDQTEDSSNSSIIIRQGFTEIKATDANDPIAVIIQKSGNENQAETSQLDVSESEMEIIQTGNNNKANLSQESTDGDTYSSGKANSYQEGDNNQTDVIQEVDWTSGGANTTSISQSGNDNTSRAYQGLGSNNSNYSINITGSENRTQGIQFNASYDNEMDVAINGSSNEITTAQVQASSDNRMNTSITGNSNQVINVQESTHHSTIDLTIEGNTNEVFSHQIYAHEEIGSTSIASDLRYTAQGNSNAATLRQIGRDVSTLHANQSGDNGTLDICQGNLDGCNEQLDLYSNADVFSSADHFF